MAPISLVDLQYIRRTLRIVEDDLSYLDQLCSTLSSSERARLRKLRGDVFSVRQIVEHDLVTRWGIEAEHWGDDDDGPPKAG